jgi:acrylyl-CoA reductase (NADPH)
MSKAGYKALVLEESDGKIVPSIQTINYNRLPEGDVTVAVSYSTLNYKDGLIIQGLGRLVRQYPHVPGIDFAGIVIDSKHAGFKSGDQVILTGWRVGEISWGGYCTRTRVNGDWLVKLPDGMALKDSMAIGTAGLTAMLAIQALEDHGMTPGGEGEVLVTGASGGVGSVATAALASLGYVVAACTGRTENHEYLKKLGAAVIVGRAELEEAPRGSLVSERWVGAIDNVGGPILANLLASMHYQASCAAVGLAAGPALTTSVIPFLLRAVNLLGIDSNLCSMERRRSAWRRLATELPKDKLAAITIEANLTAVPEQAGKILKGGVRGRIVIDVNG